MPDTYLEAATRAATRAFGEEIASGRMLETGIVPVMLDAALPHLEAHCREKLEARLLADEAVERAARAAWEPERIVSWDYATRRAQEDARKRIRLAFDAALKPDHTKTDERSSKEGTMADLRYEVRRHEPDDGWAWEVWDREEERAVALCTFHVGAKSMADELNATGAVHA